MSGCDVAVVGLGTMGANIARNLAGRGWRVAGYNRPLEAAQRLLREHPEAKLALADDVPGLLRMLARPRRILLLVPAGPPVDDVLAALDPLLEEGDVVADCGNSHPDDTERRLARASGRPWRMVGMGVSGGAEGALRGPSLMPGGDRAAWPVLEPVLSTIAAASDAGPCVAWCGRASAGHFVKMVHNGIEYAEMQALAEATLLLRRGLGLGADAVADLYAEWNAGELESFLLEIAAEILRIPDGSRGDGAPLVDAIDDRAGQKGTGRWTVEAALELGVPVPTIAAAVDARALSAAQELRRAAERAFGGPREGRLVGVGPAAVRDALLGSRVAAFSQGFALLRAASDAREYGTDLAEVARIWRAGCIIRARLLDRIWAALAGPEPPALLALAPELRADLVRVAPGWRAALAAAQQAGLPVPALAASLAWLDGLTTARGSASLIQAQRDWFGSHGYERTDAPGVPAHSDWAALRARRV